MLHDLLIILTTLTLRRLIDNKKYIVKIMANNLLKDKELCDRFQNNIYVKALTYMLSMLYKTF